jgi:hypothetical protein
MEKMMSNQRIEERIHEISVSTQDLQQCLSPELLAGISSKDFIRVISGMH